MISRKLHHAVAIALTIGAGFHLSGQPSLPSFVTKGTTGQLIVGGKPFLARGMELENGALDAPGDMQYANAYFAALKSIGVNLVLAPISWTFFESTEGNFNYSCIDGLINASRSHNIKLCVLWFGSIKNGNYWHAPGWFRDNPTKYFVAQDPSGKNTGSGNISPFCQAAMETDAKAYVQLMKRIKLDDPNGEVCVLMQPENETGCIDLDQTRDYHPLATAAWNGEVPVQLMAYLTKHDGALIPWLQTVWNAQGKRASGTWSQVFGTDAKAQHIFMAYYIARYVEYVAAAGAAEHNLPAFANDWLGGTTGPGGPMGGPEWQLFDVWRAAAPTIKAFGPDIYASNFKFWTDSFSQSGNPLIVPETGCGPRSAGQCWYVYCKNNGFCFSPYFYCPGDGTVDPGAFASSATGMNLDVSYKIIAEMDSIILAKQGKTPVEMTAFLKDGSESANEWQQNFQGYMVKAAANPGSRIPPFSTVIKMAANDFVAIGSKMTLTFSAPGIAVVWAERGRFSGNAWAKSADLTLTTNGSDVSYAFSTEATTVEQIRFRLSSPATVAARAPKPVTADCGLRIAGQGSALVCWRAANAQAAIVRVYAVDGKLVQSVGIPTGGGSVALRAMRPGIYRAVMDGGAQQARIVVTTRQQ